MARTYETVGWQDGSVLQPAKVTVQGTEYEVTPQVESGTTPVNATNLRKMDNEIKAIVEEYIPETLDVVLIAVTDTAPSECSTGDKYYNTEDNRIYTATDTNTWSSTGDEPIEGVSYIVFDTQTSYAYNGTELVSVGGGSGSSDIIMVYPDEATEDTKLVIDGYDLELGENIVIENLPIGTEVDFDGQASDIPAGWQEVDNVLYNNPSGSNGTITLSDDAFNYSRIDIIYSTSETYSPMLITTYPNYSASWKMIYNWQESNWGGIVGQNITFTTTGTTYQITRGTTYNVSGDYTGWKTFWASYSNGIKIFKVIGYK